MLNSCLHRFSMCVNDFLIIFISTNFWKIVDCDFLFSCSRAVTDPRDGRRVALKKLPNVFQSLVSSKRVFRELKMLCFFKHENVSNSAAICAGIQC